MERKKTLLADYQQSEYTISDVNLTFLLEDEYCIVDTIYTLAYDNPTKPLVLNGEHIELMDISINDIPVTHYMQDKKTLTIPNGIFTNKSSLIKIKTKCDPANNKSCEGLYKSGNVYCTQMEPEGFRRVTYFLDRPDIMAIYTTTIIADAKKYPVLLSNGNQTQAGIYEHDTNKHYVTWHDPFLKPCYLFALVAGDLGVIKDTFTTVTKKIVDLYLYCDKGNENRGTHALESLKKAMRWDEQVYGREYDLSIFMIVAVDAFNAGAMENKGLNIFNSSCVLALSSTTTDDEFRRIEAIVAHEYFHNWTGNRVTLRDWFQLTLKEGLTVFRDQEFSADMHSRAIQRINDVHYMLSIQFPEDASPNKHPIKPKEYMGINNFYTPTIYHKGAEVIRMLHTLLGKKTFRKAMDLYFERFDGKAICTEDFLQTMEDAYGKSLKQFEPWYHQAGTPEIEYDYTFDKENKTLKLTIKQDSNLMIPIVIGFIHANTNEDYLIVLEEKTQIFTFLLPNYDLDCGKTPIVSFNRHFSACVKVKQKLNLETLCDIVSFDTNEYCKWNAQYTLSMEIIGKLNKNQKINEKILTQYFATFDHIFHDENLDISFKAYLIKLPDEAILADHFRPIDYTQNHISRSILQTSISYIFKDKILSEYKRYNAIKDQTMAIRDYKNALLNLLLKNEVHKNFPIWKKLACIQVAKDNNMSNRLAGLYALSHIKSPNTEFKKALKYFYKTFKHDSQVITKFIGICATHPSISILDYIEMLEQIPEYNDDIPNHVRALWRSLSQNFVVFHHQSGRAYKMMADKILYFDSRNPMLAANLAQSFTKYPHLIKANQILMKKEIQRILSAPNLSTNVYETLNKLIGKGSK